LKNHAPRLLAPADVSGSGGDGDVGTVAAPLDGPPPDAAGAALTCPCTGDGVGDGIRVECTAESEERCARLGSIGDDMLSLPSERSELRRDAT
jgi:hypothetical protein